MDFPQNHYLPKWKRPFLFLLLDQKINIAMLQIRCFKSIIDVFIKSFPHSLSICPKFILLILKIYSLLSYNQLQPPKPCFVQSFLHHLAIFFSHILFFNILFWRKNNRITGGCKEIHREVSCTILSFFQNVNFYTVIIQDENKEMYIVAIYRAYLDFTSCICTHLCVCMCVCACVCVRACMCV